MATPNEDVVALTGDPLRDGLLQGSAWTFSGPWVLTYSFNLNFDFNFQGQPIAAPGGTWAASPAMKTAVERALGTWAAVANIQSSEISSGSYLFESTADIGLALTGDDLQQGAGAVALGFFPDPTYASETLAEAGYTRSQYPRPEGDVLTDNYYAGFQGSGLQDGRFGAWVLVHELGHALGLKHPFDDGGNGRPTFAESGVGAYDAERHTVMSYAGVANLGNGHAATPMPLDILAIQHIYGANLAYRTGNDTYPVELDGAMRTLWDAGGTDTLDASALTQAVTLDLRPGSLMDLPSSTVLGIAYDTLIEHATGGDANDTVSGNAADNALKGMRGSDLLRGMDGADSLSGGGGSDTLDGGNGNDVLDGGAGNDEASGGAGFDMLLGGPGHDLLRGGEQADNLIGGDGDDTLNGGKGTDSLDGGAGNDTLIGALGTDLLAGGDGTDTADYSTSPDGISVNLLLTTAQLVSLATGLDTLLQIENLIGSALADTLTGTTGNNSLVGRSGDDTLAGESGFDFLDGGDGNDSLAGGLNADTLHGGAGSDFLGGGQGTDSLVGGDGNDTLVGGLGTDFLLGGAGSDHFVFRHALDGKVNIDTFGDLETGLDVVELSASIFVALAPSVGMRLGTGAHLVYNGSTGTLA